MPSALVISGLTSSYRWRKQHGGLEVDQAKRLKVLERENVQLKKVVADQALDIATLKEASWGNL
ncbi:MAG: transposase [Candidatus Eisenbacteria sp.]|nr:transposase [Candidatus Eisenbacteria bacterium]